MDEYTGMKMFWREGNSRALAVADLCSRALIEYDGSQTPQANGYDGPWVYNECPAFKVLEGVWEPEYLAEHAQAQARARGTDGVELAVMNSEMASGDAVVGTMTRLPRDEHRQQSYANTVRYDPTSEVSAVEVTWLVDNELLLDREPEAPIAWQRDAVVALFDIAGPSSSLTGAGTEVNNINVELALAQPEIRREAEEEWPSGIPGLQRYAD